MKHALAGDPTYWLSYGGGVNSTALAVLLCEGKLPQYEPFRFVFSDTKDEKDETYAYISEVFVPYLARFGYQLETLSNHEGVLERWQRLKVVGSRTLRSCTDKAKIQPIQRHLREHGHPGDWQLIGIDIGEEHRAKPSYESDAWKKKYPLVELEIDRAGCEAIIRSAGLAIPPKSGCWHCPFMRVGEVIELALKRPDRFDAIVKLERESLVARPIPPFEVAAGKVRAQWGEKPADYWRERALYPERFKRGRRIQEEFETPPDLPCGCFDGETNDVDPESLI